jgi:hypothetical protein
MFLWGPCHGAGDWSSACQRGDPASILGHSISDWCLIYWLSTAALNSCLRRVTIPDAVTKQFDELKMSMVLLETCRGL